MASTLTSLPANLPPPAPPPPPPPTLTSLRHLNPPAPHLALSSVDPSDAAALLSAAARLGDLRLARALHRRLLRTGTLSTDSVVANSLLTAYSKCGAVAAERNVFDGMRGGLRNLVSWTAMTSCLARNGAEREALRLLGEMLESGLRPNAFTLCAAARACFRGELFHSAGGVVLGFVLKTGFWGTDRVRGLRLD